MVVSRAKEIAVRRHLPNTPPFSGARTVRLAVLILDTWERRPLDRETSREQEGKMGARGGETAQRLRAMEEQIEKLREIRRRWAIGEGLSEEEKTRRDLTLELLDGVIQDLQRKKLELQRASP